MEEKGEDREKLFYHSRLWSAKSAHYIKLILLGYLALLRKKKEISRFSSKVAQVLFSSIILDPTRILLKSFSIKEILYEHQLNKKQMICTVTGGHPEHQYSHLLSPGHKG